MPRRPPEDLVLTAGLLAAILLWGGNNVALKQVVTAWPPLWAGATRFLVAGGLLAAVLHGTRWLGRHEPPGPGRRRRLWIDGGLLLAVYIAVCNWALRFIPASHFALEMATAPVWALFLESAPSAPGARIRRVLAAVLAFAGVLVLLGPTLRAGGHWGGELLGLGAAVLWTFYSRQCRRLAQGWSGAAVTAHTMWRGGAVLLPLGLAEILIAGRLPEPSLRIAGLHLFCITLGGVVPFALWNQAVARWPVSRVALSGNLIPLSTMTWAHFTIGEPFSPTFGLSLALIAAGVLLGQFYWNRVLGRGWIPEE